jgi:hypothetical protein
MDRDALYRSDEPWFHVAATSLPEIADFGLSLTKHESLKVAVRFLRGKKMTRAEALDNECSAALQFPWYFGENWPAFDECIRDLSWLPADAYILIITHSEAVLSEEDERQFSIFLEILEKASRHWSQPVEGNESWSRPAIPFHVIFHCDQSEKATLLSRLQLLEATYQELLDQRPPT